MRDCVYGGCVAILVGVDGYPMGTTVYVQQKIHDAWWCVAEGTVEYEDLLIPEENLSRVTPADEEIVEIYRKGI